MCMYQQKKSTCPRQQHSSNQDVRAQSKSHKRQVSICSVSSTNNSGNEPLVSVLRAQKHCPEMNLLKKCVGVGCFPLQLNCKSCEENNLNRCSRCVPKWARNTISICDSGTLKKSCCPRNPSITGVSPEAN